LTLKGGSEDMEDFAPLSARRAEVGRMVQKDSAPVTVQKHPEVFA
jgi:hypothetical protein